MKKYTAFLTTALVAGSMMTSTALAATCNQPGVTSIPGKDICAQVLQGNTGNLQDILEFLGNCNNVGNNGSQLPGTDNDDDSNDTGNGNGNNNTGNSNGNNNTGNSNGNNNGGTNQGSSAYAQESLRLVNAERAKAGLSALTLSSGASQAAQVRAGEIRNNFSHTRPNGSSAFTALAEAGVSYRGAGENIAKGQSSAAQVMSDWMNSEGHRANILNPNFTTLGVGYSANGNCWVQLFTY